ncbi:MAG: LemA family protein [Candidatus Levybacteria bacterium]|nr:LemA family protein [Candidatus Levybacteria bacterium]
MDITTWIIFGGVVLVVLYVWSVYNSLAIGKVRIKEALSGIDVQLKRRIDLIPNLVESVKGYVKHEKTVLENVTKARTALMKANTLTAKAESNNMLTDALKSLFAVAEAYPNLKANENFLELQRELSDTESKIAYSRQFYNGNVRDYNTTLATFPSGTIGRMFGFSDMEFFAASEEERKKVEVKF